MRQVAVIVMVMVGIAIVFFAILLLLYFLKPLQKIEEGIAAIKNGYGEYNLQVNDYTETAGICEKINQMLGRIKVMDDSRQEFVSNVSHELKTPLTSMKVLADSINSMPMRRRNCIRNLWKISPTRLSVRQRSSTICFLW